METRELLVDTSPHIPPGRALESLATDDAERRPGGAPHSIAEIVAHLVFWQGWFRRRCLGAPGPMPAKAALGWPQVAPGSWPDVRATFLEELEQLAGLGGDPARLDAPITPALELPALARYTVRDALVHVAAHDAYHLGQVVLLRELMGLWPPPSGGWTW
jgi:uncharacterized damage-inducible protein DinB